MAATQDDFDFYTVGAGDRPFSGYNSDTDPTKVPPTVMVGGTKNAFKADNENISVRPGLKRFGPLDAADNGVVASYEWSTSFAANRIIRVLEDGQWQVYYNDAWMTLDTFDLTRFVFTTWWAATQQQELLVMVNGENAIHWWSGGIIDAVGGINTAGVMVTGNTVTTAMSASLLSSGASQRIYVANNQAQSSSARSAYVFAENPQNADAIAFTVANTAPFQSASITISFVDTLPGGPSSTTGYVLIGATKEETAENLLGFFNDPGNTTATHQEITDANTITGLGLETYQTVNSLESGDGEAWRDSGFTNGYPDNGGTIIVDSTEYTYTLVTGPFLVNISGTPTEGETGFQAIQTRQDEPVDDYACDFVATITNQLIVGSYSSPTVYFSFYEDFLDLESGNDIVAGDPDQIVLDELPRGVIVVGESAYIPAGSGNWYICKPNTALPIPQTVTSGIDRYVIVEVDKRVGAAKSAALAHEFIAASGENVVYLDQGNQLRQFGIFANVLGTKIPTVSQPVKDELAAEDFTGGFLRIIEDIAYIIAPISGKTYQYWQKDDVDTEGNIVSEKIWQPPFEWNISRIAIIEGVLYGYSSQNPETYQLWNTGQWHDDSPVGSQAYECVVRFGYWQFRDRTKLGDIDKVFLEGYMPQNTPLTCSLRSEYLGSTSIEDIAVGTAETSPTLYMEDGVLIGDALVGQELIGGASGMTGIPKFRAIPQYKKHQCFEYQVELYSYALDARWELLCMGTNGSQVINKPVYLLKG